MFENLILKNYNAIVTMQAYLERVDSQLFEL